jgi:predicted HicB family RNase H-like nuclease
MNRYDFLKDVKTAAEAGIHEEQADEKQGISEQRQATVKDRIEAGELVSLSIRVPPDLRKELKVAAAQEGVPINDLVVQLIQNYLVARPSR